MTKKQKNIILCFPPQWQPTNPYSSAPVLAGQLKAAGYSVVCMDENLTFYDYLLNPAFLARIYGQLSEQLSSTDATAFWDSIQKVERAVCMLKTGDGFYDLSRYEEGLQVIEHCLKLVTRYYAPQRISLYDFNDPRFAWDYNNLLEITSGAVHNMFLDYYCTRLEIFRQLDCPVCITVPCYTQLVGAFTLARFLKENTSLTVCLGGNMITRLKNGVLAQKDILHTFCDYFLLGDGERAIVRYADFISGRCHNTKVPGLVWLEGNELFSNPVDKNRQMGDIAFPCFDGMPLKNYYSPELCFAIEFARGCYWGRCSFCAIDVSQKRYCMREISQLVDEIVFLGEQYGITNFVFVDEAIPVKKYLEFAEEVLRRHLNIHFYSFARLEKDYTVPVLQRLKQAGLTILWWGYESRSERVMHLMNKGINLGERLQILQNAYTAGVWNHCLCMVGFPTETYDEMLQTFAEIRSNRKIFNSCAVNSFFLSYNSLMYQKPEDFGITSISVPSTFDSHCSFKGDVMPEKEYREITKQFINEYTEENWDTLWAMEYNNFDYLNLYLQRFGIHQIRSFRKGSTKPLIPLE